MRLAASPRDKLVEEWTALIEKIQKPSPMVSDSIPGNVAQGGCDLHKIRGQLELALKHLSKARKDSDLVGIIDALELAYAEDCIVVALSDCGTDGRELTAG